MGKNKYYVNLATHEVSQIKYANNANFTIEANEDEIALLRAKLDNMHSADMRTFFRAHVPILSYDKDQSNNDYDRGFTEAYQMVHGLGTVETKRHIEEMGVLGEK